MGGNNIYSETAYKIHVKSVLPEINRGKVPVKTEKGTFGSQLRLLTIILSRLESLRV